MESPIIFGMVLIFLFVLILSGCAIGVIYWKGLARVAKTQQIACPLNKFCPEGTPAAGFVAGTEIIFPSSFGDLVDDEQITFPYYDSFDPTQKDLVVEFDTTTAAVPGVGATTYLGLTGVGYSDYSVASPHFTLYVDGLDGREDISSILAALFQQAFLQSDSPVRKQAFMGANMGVKNGDTFFEYLIKTPGFTEDIGSLSVSSDSSTSVTLSGVDSLGFTPAPGSSPLGLVDVYQNMNYVNTQIVAPSFEGKAGFNTCIEPSFNAESCQGLTYIQEHRLWVPTNWDPTSASTPPSILDDFDDFDDDTTGPSLQFCAHNLNKGSSGISNQGDGSGVAGGQVGGGVGGYQSIQTATNVTDKLHPPHEKPVYSFVDPADPNTSIQQKYTYEQKLVFCGGKGPKMFNLSSVSGGAFPPAEKAPANVAYASIGYPNPDTATDDPKTNHTNLGWND